VQESLETLGKVQREIGKIVRICLRKMIFQENNDKNSSGKPAAGKLDTKIFGF